MYLYVVPGDDAPVPEGGILLDFVEFIAYIKNTGRKVPAFFPSKTDLISVTDGNGDVTDELLSERLEKLNSAVNTPCVPEKIIDIIIESVIPWTVQNAEKSSGYLGAAHGQYGISYSSLEEGSTYWLLLQNGAVVEFVYKGDHAVPETTVIYKEIPAGYVICTSPPYVTGYIYYPDDISVKECPGIGIIKKSGLPGGTIITS